MTKINLISGEFKLSILFDYRCAFYKNPYRSGYSRTFLTLVAVCCGFLLTAQTTKVSSSTDFTVRDPLAGIAPDTWLRPDSTYNKSRFLISAGTGAALYGAASVGLYKTWYTGFDRTGLHSFDDWPEWNQMDKAGHLFAAYMFSRYAFAGARWSGFNRPAARYAAFGVSTLLQGTIEMLDGYSSGWGFSWTDMGANLTGSLLFTAQDIAWREQRILLKVSSDMRPVPDFPVFNGTGGASNLGDIVRRRFGDNIFERFLKDYNAQTIWVSVNPKSFLPKSRLPVWLNVAAGYGSENVYGALGNVWRVGRQPFKFQEDRYRQYFLSPDIYFSRIPTKKRWVRLVFGILDSFKFPAPALELSQGRLKGRWIMW